MTAQQCKTMLMLAMLATMGCRAPQSTTRLAGGPIIESVERSATATAMSNDASDIEVQMAAQSPAAPIVHLTNYQNTASQTTTDGLVRASEPIDLPVANSIGLSLEDAIALALRRNPDLAAVRASEPVAIAAMRVAETYPFNPQFQTQVLPYSRDRNGADGAVSQQHVLVQTFELGGQQQHREGIAAASWAQVHGTIHQAELMNAAQTARLFFAVIYLRELRDLSQSLADLNQRMIGVIERREKAGQANMADVQLTRLQSQASRRQQRLAEANYQAGLMNLRNQLNFDPDAPLDLADQWMDWRWQSMDQVIGGNPSSIMSNGTSSELRSGSSPDSRGDAALRQLVANRPDVAAARSAVAMASENVRLADAMRRPNVQAGPMYQFDEGSTTFWGVQAQIDIPVVNTGKPLVQQRLAELRLQQTTASQLENRAVLEARAAIQRYERARRLVEQSRADFDRDLSDALKPFEDQFQAGQITLPQVLAARTTLSQSQQSFFDLLNELSLATADIIQATGLPPRQLITIAQP